MNKRELSKLLRAAERQAAAEAARRGHAVQTWEFDPEAYDFEDQDSPLTRWAEASCLASDLVLLRRSLRQSVPSASHLWELHLHEFRRELPDVRRRWQYVLGTRAPF